MSSERPLEADHEDSNPDPEAADIGSVAELRAQLDLLREENQQLRTERRRALQARHRQTAIGLAGLGLVALAGAAVFVDVRDVLLALAGVGLFSGLLVYYLAPERFIAATVGDAAYDAYARTGNDLVFDLGLSDHRVYVPTSRDARLFVPQYDDYGVPSGEDLEGVVVVSEAERTRGIAFHPTGAGLYREFEQSRAGDPATDPETLAGQLADAVVEAFELADAATGDVGTGRLSVAVTNPVYGSVDEFDHPVASFVGVAVARTLDRPVELDVSTDEEVVGDWIITVTWDPDANPTLSNR
jgi:hypothetical protein